MAEFSPKIETLDDESSPTAPIRALVVNSLALSSPIRQIQSQASYPAKPLAQIQNPYQDFSSPSSETLTTSLLADKGRDCQIIPTAQITPDNNSILRITNTAYSVDDNGDSYIPNFEYLSDDGSKMKRPKSLDLFSWWTPKNRPTGVGAGLDNSGNTCFIAAVLQCFTHTVPLLDSLRAYKYQYPCNCGNENFCVLMSLRNHIERALRSSGYDLKIDWFRDNLNYFSADFRINNQEDAHEFLQSFLDKLEICCLDRSSRNNPASVSSQDVNIVHNVFGGRLVSKLRCCNCNSISETFESSLGWSLEIDDVDSLSNALESFTCVEKLEDQLTCDDCKEKVSKEKQLKFDKLPLVATFHLKRFKNDGVYMEKIFKDVKFPLELDLLPYMSSNASPEVSTKYHLYAMVEHLGSGVYYGHYSAFVRSSPEIWHHFDDAKVSRIDEECVLSKNAYMLFYAREKTPCFASAFEELKRLFEATPTPMHFSPKSVLETTTTCSEECVSDHSNQNVSSSNKACNGSVGASVPGENNSDYQCCDEEPQEEVFHSAESNSDDDSLYESPKADVSENPFDATFHQEERRAGYRATIDDAYVPVHKIQEQVSSPKRKASERAIIDEEAYLPNPKMQKTNQRQGTYQLQREHLQNKKKREETHGTKPLRSIAAASVADHRGKKHAVSYLRSRPISSRSRMLVAALGGTVKKKKVTNLRRSHLHKNHL